ncbi:MAG: hypothetical protein AAF387_13040, partial [Pseudomonadota bacterium]
LARAADPEAYIQELAKAGYATDPRYAEKIIAISRAITANSADSSVAADAENLIVSEAIPVSNKTP